MDLIFTQIYLKIFRMRIRSVSCTAILLISMVIVNARTMEPISTDQSESLACNKCLLVSRKAEETLNSQNMFNEAHKLSTEACHVFPSISQDKCLKKSGAYLHEAKQIIQEFFDEYNLCNGTGLCAEPEPPVEDLEDGRGCAACKKAFRELMTRLKQPKMRAKIVEALLDYCEEADEDEEQCKKTIREYGPVIMHKLEKFRASELCHMIGMCADEEVATKIQSH